MDQSSQENGSGKAAWHTHLTEQVTGSYLTHNGWVENSRCFRGVFLPKQFEFYLIRLHNIHILYIDTYPYIICVDKANQLEA